MRTRKVSLDPQGIAIYLILLTLVLAGCHANRSASTSTAPAPISKWEQTNYDNAQIAIHNRAAAKTLVVAQQAGYIDVPTFDKISKGQIRLTKIQSDLTPLLKDQPTAATASAKVKALTDEASAIVAQMISDGTAGVTNPSSQTALLSDVSAIKSALDSMLVILTSSGVLK